jgi:integrase
MPRRIRSADLETRTARLKLPVRKKPFAAQISPGTHLLYRRNAKAGSWSVKARNGKGGYWSRGFAHADDAEAANGGDVLDFWQAVDRARSLARSGDGQGDDKPLTVAQAIDQYEADLEARGGDVGNAKRVRTHLPNAVGSKLVSALTARDLQRVREAMLAKGGTRDTINRTGAALKAALTLAANRDERIANRTAWRIGLARLPNAGKARNVILTDDKVLELIAAAYGIDRALGLMVEVAAVTGARAGQIARLEVQDLQDGTAPRLLMPASRKGSGRKVERRPVPIPMSLAAKLKAASSGRAAEAPLLLKQQGGRWRKGDHWRPFQQTALAVGLDPAEVTLYAFRHSSIVRELLANVPVRIVATKHDTSVAMIESAYSKYISDHADALSRRALLDPSAGLPADNVSPLRNRITAL